MSAVLSSSAAAALPGAGDAGDDSGATRPSDPVKALQANRAWEVDRALMLERSERRAWWVAIAGLVLGLIGIAAVFVQGPLRQIVEIPIVVDRVTGEATIQQRLSVETIPHVRSARQAQPRDLRAGPRRLQLDVPATRLRPGRANGRPRGVQRLQPAVRR
ncbi:MAG: VirB8/TrbF family protein [Burkholderiaceae bacterium]